MTGTRDFHTRVPVRWYQRRAFGMESDGLWGMVTREKTPRMIFHKNLLGWTASVSAFGSTVLVGRMQKVNAALNVHVIDEDDEA